MRIAVSLLTAVCFIAAAAPTELAEASATGVAAPQAQAAPSALKPSTIDQIKRPSPSGLCRPRRPYVSISTTARDNSLPVACVTPVPFDAASWDRGSCLDASRRRAAARD